MHRWKTRNAIFHTTSCGLLREEITQSEAVSPGIFAVCPRRTARLWQSWADCTGIDQSPLPVCYWWQNAQDMPPARVTTIGKSAICRWTWHRDVHDNSNEWRSALQWYCFWTLCSLVSCGSTVCSLWLVYEMYGRCAAGTRSTVFNAPVVDIQRRFPRETWQCL